MSDIKHTPTPWKEQCFYFEDREGKEMFLLGQFINGQFLSGTLDYLEGAK